MRKPMRPLFTRDEAERLLPKLEPLLIELRDAAEQLEAVRDRLEALPAASRQNGRAAEAAALDGEAAALTRRIGELIDLVQSLGAELKDIRTGLIDFRSSRYDHVVYLCWRLGEPRILYWHELDAGFAGRQPLD
jgi:hypothetical protein